MTLEEARIWRDQLGRYQYPVNLANFRDRQQFADNWFRANLIKGDWQETTQFENRFRQLASQYLEPWFEVVFWKLYTIPPARNNITQAVIQRTAGTALAELSWACSDYVRYESRDSFERLQAHLIGGDGLAVVATFAAFAEPERFPMVDTNVGNWVSEYLAAYIDGFQRNLLERTHGGPLNVANDWNFYVEWIRWCRDSAQILSERTGIHWRARDVEMAAFRNAQERVQGIPLLPAVY